MGYFIFTYISMSHAYLFYTCIIYNPILLYGSDFSRGGLWELFQKAAVFL